MITLPWPPSINSYWRSPSKGPLAGRTMISQEGREYRRAVVQQAQAEGWATFGAAMRLAVRIDAYMPDKRRRDLDNLPKAVLDALTHAGLWGDDSQIDYLSIRRAETLGGMLKVHVEEVAEVAAP